MKAKELTIMRQLVCLLLATLGSIGCAAAAPVLLISVDGLHPAYVTAADSLGLRIPALRQFVRAGAHARGVVGVVPTVTYPNHTTLVTGVAPDRHGIVANTTFDPLNANREGWYWYA
jgi:predicted AlkP superfamily pyrophosphatase or phosphodiesterase